VAGAVEVGAIGRGYLVRFPFLHFFFLADSAERLCFFLCFLHFYEPGPPPDCPPGSPVTGGVREAV
jgi:hypothetical protein